MDKTWNVLGTNLGNTLKCRLPCDLNATLELYNNYRNWMYITEETIIDKSASPAGLKSDYIAEGFMDINERCQKLPVIKTHRNPWGGGLQEDGTLQFPFPIYSKSVCDWIDALYKGYLYNWDKKEFEKLSVD